MTEHQTRQRFHGRADRLDVGPPPLDRIATAGRRRRRLRGTGLVCAAVGLVMGGVATVASVLPTDRAESGADDSATQATCEPQAIAVRSGDDPPYITFEDSTCNERVINATGKYEDYPTISPAGRLTFVSGDLADDQTSIVMLNDDGTQTTLVAHDRRLHFPAWSPNGQQLAYISEGPDGTLEAHLLDRETQQTRFLGNGFVAPAWSPDGTMLAFGGSENGAVVMNLATRAETTVSGPPGTALHQPAWSPDGHQLMAAAVRNGSRSDLRPGTYSLVRIDVKSGDVTSLATRDASIVDIAWTQDGKVRIAEQATNSTKTTLLTMSTRRPAQVLDRSVVSGVPSLN